MAFDDASSTYWFHEKRYFAADDASTNALHSDMNFESDKIFCTSTNFQGQKFVKLSVKIQVHIMILADFRFSETKTTEL